MNNKQTYFSLIQKVGSKGLYQNILFITVAIQYMMIGGILLGPNLLFAQSNPDCSHIILKQGQTCIQYVCLQTQSQWPNFFPNKVESLRYAFNNYFICDKQWIVTILQSCVYFGAFVSNLIFSNIPDNYGRKFMYMLSWGLICFGIILLASSWNIICIGIGLFLVGLGVDPIENISILLLSQQIELKRFQYYSILIRVAFTLGGLIQGQIFHKIGHWRFFIIYLYLIPSITSFFLLLIFQQTPRYNCKKGVKIAIDSLGRIARINGLKQNPVTQADIIFLRSKTDRINQMRMNKKISFKDLFRYKSLRTKTICITIIQSCIIVFYYGPFFMMSSIDKNQYLNQILLNLSQILTYPLAFFTINKVLRKKIGIFSPFLFGLLYLIIIFMNNFTLIEVTLLTTARFIMCYWLSICIVYCNQLIPSIARGVRACFSGIIYRGCAFTLPYLIQSLQNNRIYPILFFIGVSIVGVIAILPLKQTLHKQTQQEIQELIENYENERSQSIIINMDLE